MRVYCEYKTQERIHRHVADWRLLAIPASWGRVSALNPNWDRLWWDYSPACAFDPLYRPLYHVCSPGHQGPCWFGVILAFLPIISGSPLWHIKHRARVAFVTRINGTSQDTNWRQPCSTCPTVLRSSTFIEWSVGFLVLVRFFVCCRIKPHGPLLVWVPVYSFEF